MPPERAPTREDQDLLFSGNENAEKQKKEEKKENPEARARLEKDMRAAKEAHQAVEKDRDQGEKDADKLWEKKKDSYGPVQTEKAEQQKSMQEFIKDAISDKDYRKIYNKKQEQIMTVQKQREAVKGLQNTDVERIFDEVSDQFIQEHGKDFEQKDQSPNTQKEIVEAYIRFLNEKKDEIVKKMTELADSMKRTLVDRETKVERNGDEELSDVKTYQRNGDKLEEISADTVARAVREKYGAQFSHAKLLEAYVHQQKLPFENYKASLQEIFKQFGLKEDEAKKESEKIYEAELKFIQKEIAKREELKQREEQLRSHIEAFKHLEGKDLWLYSRAVQGDTKASDELKSGAEQRQLDQAKSMLKITTLEEKRVWEETEKIVKESNGNVELKIQEGKVLVTYHKDLADERPIRCTLEKTKEGFLVKPDLEHEFFRAGIDNPLFDARQFQGKPVHGGSELFEHIRNFKRVVDFQRLLNGKFYTLLSNTEKEALRNIFSNPETCLNFMNFINDHYRKMRGEKTEIQALEEIMKPIVQALDNPPQNFFLEEVQIELDPSHLVEGKWFDESGKIFEDRLQNDLTHLADWRNKNENS